MRTQSILQANNKLHPPSNKIVYLDTFASKDVSESQLFQSKQHTQANLNQNFNLQPPNSTPNMSLFSKSLVSFEDLQDLLLARKKNLTEELVRMKNVNKQLRQESGVWRRRENEFRKGCEDRGMLGATSREHTVQSIQAEMAINDAREYLRSKNNS